MLRIPLLLAMTAVLLSGCTFPQAIQPIQFPETVEPGERAVVVWALKGYDPDQEDHQPHLLWSHDGHKVDGGRRTDTAGNGPDSVTRFISYVDPLEEGEHIYYKAVVKMDGKRFESGWNRLEAEQA